MADDIGNIIGAITGILTLKQWIITAIIVFALWKLTSKKEKFATMMTVPQMKQAALDEWNEWNKMPQDDIVKGLMNGEVADMKTALDAVMKTGGETSTNVNRLNGTLSRVYVKKNCLQKAKQNQATNPTKWWLKCLACKDGSGWYCG